MDSARSDTAEKTTAISPMFTPFTLRGMTVPNRIAVSPMCMYSAIDGMAGDFQLVHLGSRAMGGAGLVMTEMTNVSPEGRISPFCAGFYKPEHVAPWKRVVDFVHGNSDSKICIQLAHAGRKGSMPPPWQRGGRSLATGGWQTVAPSAIPFHDGDAPPRAMEKADLDKVRDDFVRATRWSEDAGFDMIELHMGHGYLLSSFLSPLSNKRTDSYGGSIENRLRFPLEVFSAVRAAWPEAKPISIRISAVDWEDGGNTIEDGVTISRAFKAAGADIIDASSGNVTSAKRPAPSGLFQAPFATRIRKDAGIPTMAVGNIRSADDVNMIVEQGMADLCAVGRWHLFDAYFGRHAEAAFGYRGHPWANQYKRAAEVL
jgi:anthraniloyl-CoA monooxygenase